MVYQETQSGDVVKTITKYIVFFGAFYLAVTQIIPRIFALGYEAKNATVVLQGCDSEECSMQGTLTLNPITLDNVLIKDDGTRVTFRNEAIAMIVIPQESSNE